MEKNIFTVTDLRKIFDKDMNNEIFLCVGEDMKLIKMAGACMLPDGKIALVGETALNKETNTYNPLVIWNANIK